MKLILVALAFVAVASAASIEGPPAPFVPLVEILRYLYEQQPEGDYRFGYETSDGSKRQETGSIKLVPDEENQPKPVVVVTGSYTYTDPKTGITETISYVADENGYHAEGPSVPKVPESSRR